MKLLCYAMKTFTCYNNPQTISKIPLSEAICITNHASLKWIFQVKNVKVKMARWMRKLKDYINITEK